MYYSTAECVETALRQRPEMQAIRLQAEQADIRISIAKNDLLPRVDLVAGLQTNGLDHQFDTAFGNTLSPGNSLDFNAGIKIEIPIGNRLAEATLKQRQLESRQVLTNLAASSKTIMEDVRNQLRIVLTAYVEIEHYDRAREAAAQYVQGILDIQELRAKSPEFLLTKLDSQFQLSQAEQNYTQAIVAYNIAIMRLEQAKGTLLEFNHISLDRPPRTPADSDANKLRFLGHTEVTK
jgi:HAE1 family hydrophobic/amphiphilic exporter-1